MIFSAVRSLIFQEGDLAVPESLLKPIRVTMKRQMEKD